MVAPEQLARRPRHQKAAAGVLLTLVLGLALSLMTAVPASAHAVVLSSTPADKARLDESPNMVTITFSEAVTPSGEGIRVLDRIGTSVDNHDVHQMSQDGMSVTLKPNLADGTYVVNYAIVSADGHPIKNSMTFTVGTGVAADVSALTTQNDPFIDGVSKVGQFLTYVGILLTAGLAFFLAYLHDGGPERAPLRLVARLAAGLGIVGMVIVVLGQSAQITGEGLGSAFHLDDLRSALAVGLGWQDLALLAGTALCLVSVVGPKRTLTRPLALYGGIIASASFVLWGHATEGSSRWASIPADIVHLVVAAVWFGGLVGLGNVLRTRNRLVVDTPAALAIPVEAAGLGTTTGRHLSSASSTTASARHGGHSTTLLVGDDDTPVPTRSGRTGDDDAFIVDPVGSTVGVVQRFSTAASISLAALLVAGVVLGLSELGSVGALFDSDYGRLLLVKVALVAVVAAAGGYNRFVLVKRMAETPSASPTDNAVAGWRTLLKTVRFEVTIIIVVLGVTAVLVNTTPPTGTAGSSTTAAPSGPINRSFPLEGGTLEVQISPAEGNVRDIHFTMLDPTGKPAELARKLTVEMELPQMSVGPFERTPVKLATGHYAMEDVADLSIAGEWKFSVIALVSDFEEKRVEFTESIR